MPAIAHWTQRRSRLCSGVMTAVTVVGLIDRPHRIRHLVGWASLSIVAVYLLNAFVQYRFGSS
jgi:hypothetical protein